MPIHTKKIKPLKIFNLDHLIILSLVWQAQTRPDQTSFFSQVTESTVPHPHLGPTYDETLSSHLFCQAQTCSLERHLTQHEFLSPCQSASLSYPCFHLLLMFPKRKNDAYIILRQDSHNLEILKTLLSEVWAEDTSRFGHQPCSNILCHGEHKQIFSHTLAT